jgi:membrane-bound serine protease (ClpP class)
MALLIVGMMVCGMVLMVAEVAVIPGFGVAGVASAALLAGAVVLAWQRFGIIWGVGALLGAAAATGAVLLIVPRTRAGRALVLSTALKPPVSAAATVGQEGVSVTALRPAGAAEFAGKRLDVVTDGVFLEAGRPIRVVAVEGARVVVAPV